MPADVDPELIVDAVLLTVADKNTASAGTGNAWLLTEFTRVMAAVMNGDVFVSGLNMAGSSSQQMQNVDAKELLAVLTQARKRLPDANGENAGGGATFIPRLADFPLT